MTVHIEPPLHVTPPYALKNDPMGLQQSFPARRDPGAPGNAIERSELSLVWPNTHASILVVLYLWDGASILFLSPDAEAFTIFCDKFSI